MDGDEHILRSKSAFRGHRYVKNVFQLYVRSLSDSVHTSSLYKLQKIYSHISLSQTFGLSISDTLTG